MFEKLLAKFDSLAATPGLGRVRSELSPWLRILPVGNYLVIYQPIETGVEIVRVLHGARDLDALFNDPADGG